MSVVSAPLKNDIAMQKDLFRLAASIYSESSDVVSDSEIQTQIIRCMFVARENEYLTKSEIISNLLDIYKYHISEDEVDAVIRKSRGVFQSVLIDECRAYRLTSQAYAESVEMQKNSIDDYIDQFIDEKQISEPEKCKNAIHIYLYELTTTNINSYRVLLSGKMEHNLLVVNCQWMSLILMTPKNNWFMISYLGKMLRKIQHWEILFIAALSIAF